MENPVQKVGEFTYDGLLFVVVLWGGKAAAYVPEQTGIIEFSGWSFPVRCRIRAVFQGAEL